MSPQRKAKVNVTIRVDKQLSAQFSDVLEDLKTMGLTDVAAHERFLMVNGSVSSDRIDDLKNIQGVASVREDQTYKPQG